MSFEVVVDWSPVHELFASLWAFTDHKLMKNLEIGQQWYRKTAEQVGSGIDVISNTCGRRNKATLSAHALLRECPESMTPERFLDWLRGLGGEDIARYGMSGPHRSRNEAEGLLKQRDDLATGLEMWNCRYFSSVDSGIIHSLKMESRARSADVARVDPQDAVEDATNGILLADPGIETVVLTPQYHFRPYNIHGLLGSTAVYMYPVDLQSAVDSDPPPQLERLARAVSDPSRLRILKFLNGQARSFTEILEFSGLAKSTVHYHMVVLRAAGIVRLVETRDATLYTLRPGYSAGIGAMLRRYVEGL